MCGVPRNITNYELGFCKTENGVNLIKLFQFRRLLVADVRMSMRGNKMLALLSYLKEKQVLEVREMFYLKMVKH